MISRFISIAVTALAVAVGHDALPNVAVAQDRTRIETSIDDWVERAEIPLAAISPDGHYVAYLVVRGNSQSNDYQVSLRVVGEGPSPTTVFSYRLDPSQAFDSNHWFAEGAGDLSWISNEDLLFTAKTDGKSELRRWNARDRSTTALLTGFDWISLSGEIESPLITTKKFLTIPPQKAPHPTDLSWRMKDTYTFDVPLRNPKVGANMCVRQWALSTDRQSVTPNPGATSEQWESLPNEWQETKWSTTSDSYSWLFDEVRSPDGAVSAAMENRFTTLHSRVEQSYRVILKDKDGKTSGLTPFTAPHVLPYSRIIGWRADGASITFLHVSPRETEVRNVSLTGMLTTVARLSALLEKPCPLSRNCQLTSRDGRLAVLTRSTNTTPSELVLLDVDKRTLTALDTPNQDFSPSGVQISYHEIRAEGADSWGRLYTSSRCTRAKKCPLVITQYQSSPGFDAAIGDEVPILPLVEHGIAVFAMYSGVFNRISTTGDFKAELDRVRRPLTGMKWLAGELDKLGIIDTTSVGLTGLSYGAEIALYGYWNWPSVRAVSVSGAGWDPSLYNFSSVNYAKFVARRGLPKPDEIGIKKWRAIAAAMHGAPNSPPLLIQSADSEQVWNAPTWSQLRRSGAPVEWFEYPGETHVKRGPANKWWVLKRNLDWFRYWLKGEADTDPTLTEQYVRWQEMRPD